MKEIYLDNAASTLIDPRVIKAMNEASKNYGNPSSFNDAGRKARQELQKARQEIARFIGASETEIIFTGSGSESNNLAIKGTLIGPRKGKIISSLIEHPSVLETLGTSSKDGFKTAYLSVDSSGIVNLKELERKLSRDTILVSIMYANNEIGTIEPIKAIGKLIRNFRGRNRYPLFHVDACQAVEYCDMNVQNLGIDLLSFNGSKIYGPRGVGVLYVRRGVELYSLIKGGGQENGLRAGTENLPGISGLAKAISLISPKDNKKVQKVKDYFLSGIIKALPDVRINSPINNCLPNNINISVSDLSSEQLLLELDKYGIRAGSGSACTSRSVEPSHVLKAIGVKKPYLDGALRFSLGRQTAKKDIDHVLKVLPKVISGLNKRYGK